MPGHRTIYARVPREIGDAAEAKAIECRVSLTRFTERALSYYLEHEFGIVIERVVLP